MSTLNCLRLRRLPHLPDWRTEHTATLPEDGLRAEQRLQALREWIGNSRPVFNTLLIGIVYCPWSEMDVDELEDDDKTLGGWCVVFAFLAQQCTPVSEE